MSDAPGMKCLRCQGEMVPLGHETLVTGGSGATAKFFSGPTGRDAGEELGRQRLPMS